MKTIAVTLDSVTLRLLDELSDEWKEESRSALVRRAVRDLAERVRRRRGEEAEAAIFRRHRAKLARQAAALVKEQARQ